MSVRRDTIIDAAIQVIESDGLGAFAQTRVATQAGMRQSHLTYYFPTKSDLLHAVADRVVDLRVATVADAQTAEDGRGKLGLLADVLTDPRQTRLLLALVESADSDDYVRHAFEKLRVRLEPTADDILRAFGRTTSPAARHLLQSTSTGIAVLALVNGGAGFRDQAIELLRVLVESMGGSESPGPDRPTS